MSPSKRDLSRRVADLGASAPDPADREPWGLYPEGPERREAMNAAREVMHAAGFVAGDDLPADRRENQHARLDLLHERFPDAVSPDDRRDEAVVETALPLLAGSDLHVDVPDLFTPLVGTVPEWWSTADAQAYAEHIARDETEAAHSLLIGLAYDVLAEDDGALYRSL